MFDRELPPVRISTEPFGPLAAVLPDAAALRNKAAKAEYERIVRQLEDPRFQAMARMAVPDGDPAVAKVRTALPDSRRCGLAEWPHEDIVTVAQLGALLALLNPEKQRGYVSAGANLASVYVLHNLNGNQVIDSLLVWIGRMFFVAGLHVRDEDEMVQFVAACCVHADDLVRLAPSGAEVAALAAVPRPRGTPKRRR